MNGTIYTDLTGAFPVTSARGNKLLYIAYSYDANIIMWEPMKMKNESEMSRVFKTVYEKLDKRGIKPKFHIMDNEASSTVMSCMEQKNVDAQKVAPQNHQANTAERMIETVKHHFIAGMAGTDENYPIREWERGVAQSQRTLNMLRPCRINPKLSSDAFLEGQQDYNSVSFPPLRWRMLIFEGPEKWSSWGFHGVEGFSVGPAEKNYRCYTGWVPTKGAEKISDTVVFFPSQKYTYDLPAPPT